MTPTIASKPTEKETQSAPPASCGSASAEHCMGAPAGLPMFLKSQVNVVSDSLEREADFMAVHLTSGTTCACQHEGKSCPKCEAKARRGEPGTVSRKASGLSHES